MLKGARVSNDLALSDQGPAGYPKAVSALRYRAPRQPQELRGQGERTDSRGMGSIRSWGPLKLAVEVVQELNPEPRERPSALERTRLRSDASPGIDLAYRTE